VSAALETAFAASVLQAFGFRGDVTVFRLNAEVGGKSCSEPAFRRNTAERVYAIEAAHNPEVAGSNPAPATRKGPGNRAFLLLAPDPHQLPQASRTMGACRHGRTQPTQTQLRTRLRTRLAVSPHKYVSPCLMQPGARAERRLLVSSRPWPQWNPAFSPDGRKIAFRGYYSPPADGVYALYVARRVAAQRSG
jgi:hypothetical protein